MSSVESDTLDISRKIDFEKARIYVVLLTSNIMSSVVFKIKKARIYAGLVVFNIMSTVKSDTFLKSGTYDLLR